MLKLAHAAFACDPSATFRGADDHQGCPACWSSEHWLCTEVQEILHPFYICASVLRYAERCGNMQKGFSSLCLRLSSDAPCGMARMVHGSRTTPSTVSWHPPARLYMRCAFSQIETERFSDPDRFATHMFRNELFRNVSHGLRNCKSTVECTRCSDWRT